MIPLGLSAADHETYLASFTGNQQARVRAAAWTLGGDVSANLTDYLDDGQVNIDGSAAVTRSATIVLHDPRRSLPFDTDSPASTALFMDRMIRLHHEVRVGDDWVPCPLFTGPITKLDRDGDMVTVECQGKETLLLGAAWTPFTLSKGMKKTDAIRSLLTEANPVYAETRMDIPDRAARLPKAISLVRDDTPWHVARRIAHSMGMQLFYDGRGVCRLRHRPGTAGFSFHGKHHVLTAPQISYSADVVNAVVVRGHDPKGPANQVVAFAVAPAAHPLSPQRIGRYLLPNGKVIHDDKIKTHAEALTRANRRLEDGLRQAVDVSFDSVPLPFFDPGDLCHVGTDDASVTFRLRQTSFPLLADDSNLMSVGYHRRVSWKGRHRRRHKHR